MSVSPSTVVRADLVGLIEQELLGPRGGAEEEIRGTPRAAYLVGGLAPVTIDPSLGEVVVSDDGADPALTGAAVMDIDPESNGQTGVPVATDEQPGFADGDEARYRQIGESDRFTLKFVKQ